MSMQSICVKNFYGTEVVYERKNRFYRLSVFLCKGLQRRKGEKICMKDMSPRAMT